MRALIRRTGRASPRVLLVLALSAGAAAEATNAPRPRTRRPVALTLSESRWL